MDSFYLFKKNQVCFFKQTFVTYNNGSMKDRKFYK